MCIHVYMYTYTCTGESEVIYTLHITRKISYAPSNIPRWFKCTVHVTRTRIVVVYKPSSKQHHHSNYMYTCTLANTSSDTVHVPDKMNNYT